MRESGMQAVRELFRSNSEDVNKPDHRITVEKSHFDIALKKIQPSLTSDVIKDYDKMAEEVSIRRAKIESRSFSSYT